EAVTATRTAVIDAMIAQAAPFADMLEIAEREAEPAFEQLAPIEEPAAAAVLPDVDADFEPVRARLLELGMPEAATAALIREAERGMRPFDQSATPEQLVRRAFARQVRIEHGWKAKRRTIALVGSAGAGKTLAAAKLCHAYAAGSRLAVRTLSLEPAAAAYRLGTLTEHLDIGLRIADTPEAA